jgi:hypothetical protein
MTELPRLKPPPNTQAMAGYTIDHVVIELVDGVPTDLRLELGMGYDFYWAMPAKPGAHLGLVHVDNAVMFVDEPTLIQHRCTLDPIHLRWQPQHPIIVSVTLEAQGCSYQCTIEGQHKNFVLAG